jgi:hypothetical protein
MEDHEDERESEDRYRRTLVQQRHMYAWCLQQYGGRSPAEAEAEALDSYPYEPASAPHRELIFHDEAWHWAMLRIHRGSYWLKSRALERPSEDYRREEKRWRP